MTFIKYVFSFAEEFIVWNKSELKKLLAEQDYKLSTTKDKDIRVKCSLNCFKDNTSDDDISLNESIEISRGEERRNSLEQCQPMFPHEDETKWFLPKCDRNSAEKLLKGRRDGTFLVRNSFNLEDKYVLSIVLRGHIKHIVIQKTDDGFCLHGDESHPTLYSLVMFYAQPSDHKCDSKCPNSCKVLHFPVFE